MMCTKGWLSNMIWFSKKEKKKKIILFIKESNGYSKMNLFRKKWIEGP